MGQNRAAVGATGVPRGGLEGFFRLREHGTDARTEVLAGLTTFFVMSYIIAVNPAVLAAAGLDVRAVATSTCLVAGLLSIAMGLYTNRAYAIAPGIIETEIHASGGDPERAALLLTQLDLRERAASRFARRARPARGAGRPQRGLPRARRPLTAR